MYLSISLSLDPIIACGKKSISSTWRHTHSQYPAKPSHMAVSYLTFWKSQFYGPFHTHTHTHHRYLIVTLCRLWLGNVRIIIIRLRCSIHEIKCPPFTVFDVPLNYKRLFERETYSFSELSTAVKRMGKAVCVKSVRVLSKSSSNHFTLWDCGR